MLSLAGRDDGVTTVAFAPSVSIFTASVTTCPSVKVNIPFAVIGVFNVMAVTGKVLFTVKFVKLGIAEVPLIDCCTEPFKVTLVPHVKVPPLRTIFPPT